MFPNKSIRTFFLVQIEIYLNAFQYFIWTTIQKQPQNLCETGNVKFTR